MEKTRDLFKKIKDTKGTISQKNGLNKRQKWYGPNRNRRYQEVETIQRRTIQKNLNDPDNYDSVITHQSQTFWNAKSSGL